MCKGKGCTGIRGFAFALLAGVFVGTAHAEEYNINPGMWETTYKTEATGLPAEAAAMMGLAPKVERHCVKDKNYEVSQRDQRKGCTFKSTRHSSNKISWNLNCSAEAGNSTGHGEVNFNGDTVSGSIEMNMQGPTGPAKIHTTFEGKRVGPC